MPGRKTSLQESAMIQCFHKAELPSDPATAHLYVSHDRWLFGAAVALLFCGASYQIHQGNTTGLSIMNKLETEKLITHRKASCSEFQQDSLQAAIQRRCGPILKLARLTNISGLLSPRCLLLRFCTWLLWFLRCKTQPGGGGVKAPNWDWHFSRMQNIVKSKGMPVFLIPNLLEFWFHRFSLVFALNPAVWAAPQVWHRVWDNRRESERRGWVCDTHLQCYFFAKLQNQDLTLFKKRSIVFCSSPAFFPPSLKSCPLYLYSSPFPSKFYSSLLTGPAVLWRRQRTGDSKPAPGSANQVIYQISIDCCSSFHGEETTSGRGGEAKKSMITPRGPGLRPVPDLRFGA